LDPARRHDLGALSLEYLTRSKRAIEGLIGTGKNQRTMAEVPVDAASRYACEDADLTLQLRRVLEPRLDEHGLRLLFDRVEMPLLPVLAEMELAGMAIDVPFLEKMSQQFENDLGQLMGEVYRIAGTEFNINSTKQLGEVLFERLKLPHGRKTKTGYSTDVRVLEELAVEHELPQKLLDYRHLSKLKSTYVDALPRLINPQTGRVHTSFNQTGTETGRLSSNNPNLQNIPIRTDVGREIRKAFIPGAPSHVLVSADYSQVELRLLAHLSGDEQLQAAFRTDADIHTRTAALVFNIPEGMVPADLRRQAKVVNFGIIYGMGPYGLAQALKISHEDARRFIERYFAQYPGVHAYIEHLKQEAREQGYVTTLLGRRRYIPEITSSNFQRREFAERAAINMPVQGTQADLIKVAMVRIHDELRRRGLSAKLILQVHDELVFDAPSTEAAEVSEMVKTQMERAFEPDIHLSVPIKAEVGVGKDWLEAH
ncbi:MAG: DNA polymerase I, partial [Candidatus Latescibacteria bacterium]|nr:DNA polymerase I [Candidatus Latescibacterota bacterium]